MRDFVKIATDYAKGAVADKKRKRHGKLIRIGTEVFGDGLLAVRLPFIAISALVPWWIAWLTRRAALWQVLDNRRIAAEMLETQIATRAEPARRAAAERERLVNRIEGQAFLDRTRAARPTAVEVMDELSRRLPDGTYLEKLAIEEERQALLVAARTQADGVLEQARDRLAEIEQRQVSIGEQELGLARREERLRLNEALIKARRDSLSQEFRDQFEHELQEKGARIAQLEKQRETLHGRVDRLQLELDEFNDLRDRLGVFVALNGVVPVVVACSLGDPVE